MEDVSRQDIPNWLKEYLTEWNIGELTEVQVRALTAGIYDGKSMIVSAPTSSGKTLIAEIAVQAALRNNVPRIA